MLPSIQSQNHRPACTRQWWQVVCAYLVGTAGFFLLLSHAASSISIALQWSAGAAVGLGYLLTFLWHRLAANPARGSKGTAQLGLANAITLARGGLYAGLGGCLLIPEPSGIAAWAPGTVYLGAALTDSLDGYLARRRNQSTSLGRELDVEVDGLGVLVATFLAVHYGQLPIWYLSVGCAYYVYRLVLYILRRKGQTTYPIPASSSRRLIGGVQVGFLAVVLWPLFDPPTTTVAGIVVAAAFFASFARDGLVATGAVRVDEAPYAAAQRFVHRWVVRRLPVVARGVVLIGTLLLIGPVVLGKSTPWQLILEQHPAGTFLMAAWLFVIIVTSLLVFVGAVGRLAALGLLTTACADVLVSGPTSVNTLLLIAALVIMLLGTGKASWWSPEDKYLTRQAGTS